MDVVGRAQLLPAIMQKHFHFARLSMSDIQEMCLLQS
jgi:hypothetical protein